MEHETPQRTHVAELPTIRVVSGTAYGPGSVLVTKETGELLRLQGAKVRKATEADQPKNDKPPHAVLAVATAEPVAQNAQETAPEPPVTPEAVKTDAAPETASPDGKTDPMEDKGGWSDLAKTVEQKDGIVTGEQITDQAGAPEPVQTERKGQLPGGFPARAKLIAAGLTTWAKVTSALAQLPDTLTQDEVDQVRAEMVEA